MALSTKPYKGTRDFYPENLRLRGYIFDVWRRVSKRYGYMEYDAPIIEPYDLYAAKSGQEIVESETFLFEDRGGRKVTVRPEMTPTVSRMVAARRQELAYPQRLFSIPNLWRYERPQKGRLREHWQLNVDVFGIDTVDAELELLLVASDIMKEFGASQQDYTIRINSRSLVMRIMSEYLELSAQQTLKMIKLFDKRAKMPTDTFNDTAREILENDSREGQLERLNSLLSAQSMAELPEDLLDSKSVKEIQILFTLLSSHGIENAVFDVSLMRGFDYYTDIVFEVFDNDPENSRSMFGGGRYDGLVGLFGVPQVATVGFGMGDVVLAEFLKRKDLIPYLPSEIDLHIVVVGDMLRQAQGVAQLLRSEGLNVSVDIGSRKIEKQINNAQKGAVSHVLFVGEREIELEKFKLKNIESGEEFELTIEKIIAHLGG